MQAAFAQGMTSPGGFSAAASNPKVANLMEKMREKMGMPEGTPGEPPAKPAGDDGRLRL